MNIPTPLAERLYEAYVGLFAAVENGIDEGAFFKLSEQFRNLRDRVTTHEDEMRACRCYVTAAFDRYHRDGELEVDDAAIVSLSDDGGAYVQAWLWIADDDLPGI